MAECNKCGNLLDENGVCKNCTETDANDIYTMWGKPGSSSEKAASNQQPEIDKVNATETVETSTEPEVKYAQSQIGTAEQRAAYFNAMAGVEEEEVDEQFYVSENSLFDVPFNDTKDNLGYNFPKFRNTASKKTRKSLKITALIVSAVALLTAAAIVVSNYFNFGLLTSGSEVPIIAVKDTSLYLTTSKGGIQSDMYYSDRIGTVKNTILDGKVNRVSFTSDYSRMLVVEKYESTNQTYTLHERETYSPNWITAQNNGTIVDTAICSEYKFLNDEKALVYLKLSGDVTELCVYSFADGTAKKIATNVTEFSIQNNNTVLYISDGNLHSLIYKSHTDLKTKLVTEYVYQVTTAYDYGYTDSNDYFYITVKLEYITQNMYYNAGELHCVKSGKDKKIGDNASRIIMPLFDDGAAYYMRSQYFSLGVGSFIEDDCAESDAEYVEKHYQKNSDEAFTTSAKDWAKVLRHNRRNIKFGDQTFSILDMGVYSEIADDLWYVKGEKHTEIAKNIVDISFKDEDTKTLVYSYYPFNINKLLFSEVEQNYIQSDPAMVGYCKDILLPKYKIKQFGITKESKSVDLDASYVRKADITADGKKMYFMDTEKEKSESGALKTLKLSDLSGCETVIKSIEDFEVMGNNAVSIALNDDLFLNNEKIGQNVQSYQTAENGKSVVFIDNFNVVDNTGRLQVYKNGEVDNITDGVNDFAVISENTLAYIGNYNKAEGEGTLYIASGIKSGRATDDMVKSLIRY
ncbi:MAG: hypothetical protein IIW79_00010 [Clostridia bacterium]|nr:hypothetical protein [Clostridia bacterium]